MGKCKRRDSEAKEGGREKERDEGPKETRVPECLFEFLAKWPSVRSAGPGHPSQPVSQPARVKRNHTDLHIMIYIPVLCLFYASFSRLVSRHRALRRYRRCRRRSLRLAPARAASFVSFSRFILSRNIHFWYRLEKCHFTDVTVFCQVSLFHVALFAPYSDCLAFASRFLERGTGNSCNSHRQPKE